MPSFQVVGNFVNSLIDTPESAFDAPLTESVIIDAFTITNNSQVNASFRAYIKSSDGALNSIIPFTIVVWGENDLGVGIVNQAIPPGGSLQIESSALESLYLTVTGRNVNS